MRSAAAATALAALLACQGEPAPAAPVPSPRTSAATGALGPAAPRAEGEAWTVALELPGRIYSGRPATARVVVTSRGAFHVNRDYPMSFRPDGDSTARFAGDRVALGEGATHAPCAAAPAETCSTAAPLPFTAPPAGQARVSGTVAFSVCTPERCLIEKVRLGVAAGGG